MEKKLNIKIDFEFKVYEVEANIIHFGIYINKGDYHIYYNMTGESRLDFLKNYFKVIVDEELGKYCIHNNYKIVENSLNIHSLNDLTLTSARTEYLFNCSIRIIKCDEFYFQMDCFINKLNDMTYYGRR